MENKIFALVLVTLMAVAGSLAIISAPAANALSSTNAEASVVIGQQDFTHSEANQGGAVADNTAGWPNGVWTDGKRLIVADILNNRVLIHNSIPTSPNARANVVVGQADMTHNEENQGGSPAKNTLFSPYTVSSDGVHLFVADTGNNRILIYNSIPTSNNAEADIVVGQADFTHSDDNQGGSTGPNTLEYPYAVHTDGTKLFIADGHNHRILIYNTIPASNNANADIIVGQQDFTHGSANRGSSSATANSLDNPSGIFTYNGKMYVTDAFNHRVLIFNSIPTENDASANIVVGQTDLTGDSANQGANLAANTLYTPYHAFTDGVRLFVSDYGNSRVLIYNSLPTASNPSADTVIGQANFTTNSPNQGGSVGANTLEQQGSLFYGAGKLFVGDVTNNRILIFSLDAPWMLQNKKSVRFSSDTTVKRKKTKLTFSGRKTGLGKKGRVQIFQDGVLKATRKVKKNGKWSMKVKEKQTSVNRLYQFRYHNSSGVFSGVSDQYNVYVSASGRSSKALNNSVPVSTGGLSQENEINPIFWNLGGN